MKTTEDNHEITNEVLCIDGNGAVIDSIGEIEGYPYFVTAYSLEDGYFTVYYEHDYYLYNSNTHTTNLSEISEYVASRYTDVILSQNQQDGRIVAKIGGNYYLFDPEGKVDGRFDFGNYVPCYEDTDEANFYIYDNTILCKNKDGEGQSLYLAHLDTGEITELYYCGDGKYASSYEYENGYFLVNVFGGKSRVFTLVDKTGKEKFEPIEGHASHLSGDRIIASKSSQDDSGNLVTTTVLYDTDGNLITEVDWINCNAFFDGWARVSNNETVNYIDADGNLLFDSSYIAIPAASSSEKAEAPAEKATVDPEEAAALYKEFMSSSDADPYDRFSLIYVNDDDVPELYMKGRFMAANDLLCWIDNGEVKTQVMSYQGATYLERSGLIYNRTSRADNYDEMLYSFDGGECALILKGHATAVPGTYGTPNEQFTYTLLEKETTKDEYIDAFSQIFNFNAAKDPLEKAVEKGEMVSLLVGDGKRETYVCEKGGMEH